jgi:hypothetical protein
MRDNGVEVDFFLLAHVLVYVHNNGWMMKIWDVPTLVRQWTV